MVRTLGLMEEPVRVAHRRERSAWFSAVDKATKFLFGTLNEETEKDIKDLIARSDARVTELSKLLINQTEIVYKEFKLLHGRTYALERSLIALENEQREEERAAAFTEAMHVLEEQVLQYEIYIQILTIHQPGTSTGDRRASSKISTGRQVPNLIRKRYLGRLSKDRRFVNNAL